MVDRPQDRSASRRTWRTPCSSPWATTRPKTASCPRISTGQPVRRPGRGLRKMADALRPWTIDFHVAQNDGTVKGSGSHDKTGRHCQPHDPNGKLDIVRDAGAWMRGDDGEPTRAFQHICWDGCMFPNCRDARSQDLAGRAARDDRGAQRAWVELIDDHEEAQHRHDRLRVHGPHPFQRLLARSTTSSTFRYQPGAQNRLRPQSRTRAEAFAAKWGYESVETDWRRAGGVARTST